MNKEQIKEAVLEELRLLKKHATQEELDNLDFSRFDPGQIGYCIYGQMTGSCFSGRAIRLVSSCAQAFVFGLRAGIESDFGTEFRGLRSDRYFSALEWWIVNCPETNEEIIKFLKSEIETIEL